MSSLHPYCSTFTLGFFKYFAEMKNFRHFNNGVSLSLSLSLPPSSLRIPIFHSKLAEIDDGDMDIHVDLWGHLILNLIAFMGEEVKEQEKKCNKSSMSQHVQVIILKQIAPTYWAVITQQALSYTPSTDIRKCYSHLPGGLTLQIGKLRL